MSAFLDITSAFDDVLPEVITDSLRDIGAAANIRKFVESLVNERELYFIENISLSDVRFAREHRRAQH